jgi:hypothetical protein
MFSEAFFVRYGFDIKLIYIIVFINYFLLKIEKKDITIPKFWLFTLIYLLLTGILTIFLYSNALSGVLFQVFGIAFMSIYFYNFLLWYDGDLETLFEKYCNICFILALIGIPLFFILICFDSGYRLHSLLLEPAHFCGIVIPSYYYYLVNFKRFKFKFIIIVIALLLSVSSIGFILMLLGLILVKRKVNLIVTGSLVFFSVVVAVIAYAFSDNVKLRVNDTVDIINDFKVSTNVNASTLALASNFYVSFNALMSNPLIGRGIASHPISYNKYVYQIVGIEGYEDNEALFFLNSTDAASLALRSLSELGLIGLAGILIFIIRNYSSKGDDYKISRAILLYFFYKLFREGHYFSPEMYFFVFTYYLLKVRPVAVKQIQLFLNNSGSGTKMVTTN